MPSLSPGCGTWVKPPEKVPTLVGPTSFKFLGVEADVKSIGWDGNGLEKLWRYHQHYFDDLTAVRAGARRDWHVALIENWILQNGGGEGVGWEPYPVSIRIVNWIKWDLISGSLSINARHSLAVQARWLVQRLEFHILGNHLFSNAKALVYVGLFFEGREADKWLKTGVALLRREIKEQILNDGGHFERSTMYHALALEDLLDLINIAREFESRISAVDSHCVSEWIAVAKKMMRWLTVMSHPDGEKSFFNDATFDVGLSIAELRRYSALLFDVSPDLNSVNDAVVALPESGYIRLEFGDMVAILDVAKLGPDYLLGHAHADTLSFELSVTGRRIFVNSGVSCYGTSQERIRQRGTAAHNTVIVDGIDSSEVWKGFRVADRAYPAQLAICENSDPNELTIACAHTGYHRLKHSPTHHRVWRVQGDSFVIEDTVEGPHHAAKARFHLHPDAKIFIYTGGSSGKIELLDGGGVLWRATQGAVVLEDSTWHPRFGETIPNKCLVLAAVAGKTRLELSPL